MSSEPISLRQCGFCLIHLIMSTKHARSDAHEFLERMVIHRWRIIRKYENSMGTLYCKLIDLGVTSGQPVRGSISKGEKDSPSDL